MTHQPPIRSRAPGDTLLPRAHKAGGPDSLLRSEPEAAWTAGPKRVAAGAVLAVNVVLERLRRRK